MKARKGLLPALLAAVLCICMTSCGSTGTDGAPRDNSAAETTATTAAEVTTTAAAETAPAETTKPAVTQEGPPVVPLGAEKLADGIYSIDCGWDYKLDEYLEADVKTREELDKWFMENLTDGHSTEGVEYDMACSAFAAVGAEGEHLFCRNYDLRPTDAMFIRTAPENGYSSIGIVDLAHLNIGLGCEADIESAGAQSLLRAAPFCICDGMNEKGLGVSLLQLDIEHTVKETDKHDLLVYIALRALLDKCADVDEAVEYLAGYDIYSPMRWSYHIFLTDKSGKSAVVEWLEDGQTVVEDNAATNFVLFEAPPTRDPDLRYTKLRKALDTDGVSSKEEAMSLLETVKQQEATRWSAIYDLDSFRVEACFNADYEHKYEFDGAAE